MRKINLSNNLERNYYNIKDEFVKFLVNNKLELHIDEDDNKAIIYDYEGNDIAIMTLNQLTKRVKINLV